MPKGWESVVSQLVCTGCGFVFPTEAALPFRCPAAGDGDDIDHVLSRALSASSLPFPTGDEQQPFIRYRHLLHLWHFAREHHFTDDAYMQLIRDLDLRLSRVAGRSLCVTPFLEQSALASSISSDIGALFVKDETESVAASHKIRHLFGTWAHLEIAESLGLVPGARESGVLAIASCGNAALAAAMVAQAAGRRLRAYLPSWASPGVKATLAELGAELQICPRRTDIVGDPSYLSFAAAVAAGEIPFTCQGTSNSLALDGGRTLAYEIVSTLAAEGRRLDRVFLQAGGGAMASSFIQAFNEALSLGALPGPLPRFHAVQSARNAPLVRAYDCVAARILEKAVKAGSSNEDRETTAKLLSTPGVRSIAADVVKNVPRTRSCFMWPWKIPSHSVASGILDDEAYDWWAVVRGMLDSGGFPIVVDEKVLREAYSIARECTASSVSATGSAGLAGALQLARTDASAMAGENIAIIFSGGE